MRALLLVPGWIQFSLKGVPRMKLTPEKTLGFQTPADKLQASVASTI